MGKLIYDASHLSVDIDDRALAHLQVVIGSKLRRRESFYFSWRNDVSVGGGRNTVWMHPAMNLVFRYSGGRLPALNPRWLDGLSRLANSPGGLHLTSEPDELGAIGADHGEHAHAGV